MLNKQNEVKTIYLNVPKELNLQLLFSEFKPVFIPKIQFLIHQINFNHFNGGYQINKKNHSWFLGIKDGELSIILNRLLDNEIIIKTGHFRPGERSNAYSMVNPYDYKNNDAIAKYAYQVDKYTFLQKWVADNNIVRSQNDSKYIKSCLKDLKLVNRIQLLENENKALREQLAKYEAKSIDKDIQADTLALNPAIMVALQPSINRQKTLYDYGFSLYKKDSIKEYTGSNGSVGMITNTPTLYSYIKSKDDAEVIELLELFSTSKEGLIEYDDLIFEKNLSEAGFLIDLLEEENSLIEAWK